MRGNKRKGKTERRVTALGPNPMHDACLEIDCPNRALTGCSYVDRRGRMCDTSWCTSHAHMIGERLYCRRHATIVGPLTALKTVHLPDVDNRAPGLAQWIADRIELSVIKLLQLCERPGESFLSEPLRYVHGLHDGLHRWERSWKLVTHHGVDVKVVLETDEEHDGLITLRVGRHVATRAVPPWIDHRAEGEEVSAEFDRAERKMFYSGLAEDLRETLVLYYSRMGERVPPAITQPLAFEVDDEQARAASWFGQLPLRRGLKPVRGTA